MPAEGSSSNSAPATPMFTYHTLSHPLQDASNLPSGRVGTGPSAHQQAPTEFGPGQGHREQGQPSRSSSDCFSMDPAQLEADIAALTSAIAADAAGAEGSSEGMSSYHGYNGARNAAHGASDRPIREGGFLFQDEASGLGECEMTLKASGAQYSAQYPSQYPPQYDPVSTRQQLYRHTEQGPDAAGVRMAATPRGEPSIADGQGLEQEPPNGSEHR